MNAAKERPPFCRCFVVGVHVMAPVSLKNQSLKSFYDTCTYYIKWHKDIISENFGLIWTLSLLRPKVLKAHNNDQPLNKGHFSDHRDDPTSWSTSGTVIPKSKAISQILGWSHNGNRYWHKYRTKNNWFLTLEFYTLARVVINYCR